MEILGIDVGGTGIKGAVVDTKKGILITDRYRLLTPQPPKPKPMVETIVEIVKHFHWKGPVGCGFPAAVVKGEVKTASNISKSWIGRNIVEMLGEATGCQCIVLNDADAAGIAEMRFGAGNKRNGLAIIVTLGTGIGSAMFMDGTLVPNSELGQIEINGKEAEPWAAAIVRKKKKLSWKDWSQRIDMYLKRLQAYFWPDLFIIGGGVSKRHDKFLPLLTVQCDVLPAKLRNEAGIIGAAMAVEIIGSASNKTRTRSKRNSS